MIEILHVLEFFGSGSFDTLFRIIIKKFMTVILFCGQLFKELSASGLTEHQIWSSWHGDSHLIANDQVNIQYIIIMGCLHWGGASQLYQYPLVHFDSPISLNPIKRNILSQKILTSCQN